MSFAVTQKEMFSKPARRAHKSLPMKEKLKMVVAFRRFVQENEWNNPIYQEVEGEVHGQACASRKQETMDQYVTYMK